MQLTPAMFQFLMNSLTKWDTNGYWSTVHFQASTCYKTFQGKFTPVTGTHSGSHSPGWRKAILVLNKCLSPKHNAVP